ncbi:MAG: NADH-quinone oxidoreductase subunit NuoK [Ignavibacteria bacterium]|nr:NADH-quinone oxidoreductase subunit NuoK [Ignavibacteria bacterium]
MVGLNHFLILSSILFCLGIFGVLTRKNAITVLMGLEMILNAASLNFVAISRFTDMAAHGQVISLFIIVLAASEAAIALAIVLNLYKNYSNVNVDEINTLKD